MDGGVKLDWMFSYQIKKCITKLSNCATKIAQVTNCKFFIITTIRFTLCHIDDEKRSKRKNRLSFMVAS